VVKREERPIWLSSERRLVSDIPPVLSPTERTSQNGHATTVARDPH
jgi:cell division protease FtsH